MTLTQIPFKSKNLPKTCSSSSPKAPKTSPDCLREPRGRPEWPRSVPGAIFATIYYTLTTPGEAPEFSFELPAPSPPTLYELLYLLLFPYKSTLLLPRLLFSLPPRRDRGRRSQLHRMGWGLGAGGLAYRGVQSAWPNIPRRAAAAPQLWAAAKEGILRNVTTKVFG